MSNASDPTQNPAHEHYFIDPNWPDPNGPRDAREYLDLPPLPLKANGKT